jgi:hypothetical protein
MPLIALRLFDDGVRTVTLPDGREVTTANCGLADTAPYVLALIVIAVAAFSYWFVKRTKTKPE